MENQILNFEFNGKLDGFLDDRVYQGKAIADNQSTSKDETSKHESIVFKKSDILNNNSSELLIKKNDVVFTIDIDSVKDVTLLAHQVTFGTTRTGMRS